MKLLFDQNISPKVVNQLEDIFPGASQVRHLGLENASDIKIFEFAKKNNYAIVTFDSDFVDLNVVKGSPPKIIWLKAGNLTTKAISELIHTNALVIQDFLISDEDEILEVIK